MAILCIGGDTPDPDALLNRVQEEVPRILEKGIYGGGFRANSKKTVGAGASGPQFAGVDR